MHAAVQLRDCCQLLSRRIAVSRSYRDSPGGRAEWFFLGTEPEAERTRIRLQVKRAEQAYCRIAFCRKDSKKAGLPQCRRIEPKAMDRPSVRAGHVIYIRTYYAHAWKGAEWTAGREGKEQVCRHWPPQHRKGAPHKNRAQGGSRHLRACVNIQAGDIQTRAQIYKQRKD